MVSYFEYAILLVYCWFLVSSKCILCQAFTTTTDTTSSSSPSSSSSSSSSFGGNEGDYNNDLLYSSRNLCSRSCSCLGSFVDCSKKRLRAVPSDIPAWVEILDLSRNHIRSLHHETLGGLAYLKKLDLSHNKLRKIDVGLFGNGSANFNSSLEELLLNNNHISHFPYLPNLAKLTTLNLRHNKIHDVVNSNTSSYVNLDSLDLSYNRLAILPRCFLNSSRLRVLQLINNSLVNIEKFAFDNVTSLEVLKLAKNHLESFPKDLFRSLNQLKELDLSRNDLRQVEGLTFYGLESLQVLKIKKNKLTNLLDGAFWDLRNIKYLHLDQNNLTQIKKGWLYGLSTLKHLNISHNNVSHIDGDGWEFSRNLWELDFSYNNLHSIKRDTFSRLHTLQYLFLTGNRISYIEDSSFRSLSSLQVLDLSRNEISWVVEDTTGPFIGLEKLEQLNLAQNYIKSLAKLAFSGLPRLRTLDLMYNPITSIENETFSSIKNLDELHFDSDDLLCDCQIKWFAMWLRSKPALSHSVIHAKCKYPIGLARQRLTLVELSDLKCDDSPKPYILEDPQTFMALKGSNTTLTCKAATSSSGEMTFQWRKDNRVMDLSIEGKNFEANFAHSENGSNTEYVSFLHITDTQDEDAGKYQCVVTNAYGTVYSQKAKISVNVMPVFTKQPVNITVGVGSTARLECAAKGHPPAEISWQKDGGDDFPAATERRMHVMPSDDVFFIVEVKSSDSGIYTCTAQNDAGVIKANATLVVLQTPSVTRKMKDKEAKIGETAVLQCKATGNPKPVLTWSKDDKAIVSTERHFFTLDNQLLIIVDVQAADEGKYSCEMNNVVGSAKDSTYLKVHEADNELKTIRVSNTPPPVGTWNWVLTDHQTIGVIIIAVVFCVVVTSLVWVIIIYKTRKRSEEF